MTLRAPNEDGSDDMSNVETRQVDRDSLLLMAGVRVDGDQESYRVKVRNLSAGGMLAEGDAKVALGSPVTVELRNIGDVEGSIAWVHEGRFGIAFVQEIDPKLARAPVGSQAPDLSSPRFTRPPLMQDERGKLRTI